MRPSSEQELGEAETRLRVVVGLEAHHLLERMVELGVLVEKTEELEAYFFRIEHDAQAVKDHEVFVDAVWLGALRRLHHDVGVFLAGLEAVSGLAPLGVVHVIGDEVAVDDVDDG